LAVFPVKPDAKALPYRVDQSLGPVVGPYMARHCHHTAVNLGAGSALATSC
jgi:hypothetical protein